MTNHTLKAISLADQILTKAEDAVSGLDREIAGWPAEFRAIMWDAVAAIAIQRAAAAKASP